MADSAPHDQPPEIPDPLASAPDSLDELTAIRPRLGLGMAAKPSAPSPVAPSAPSVPPAPPTPSAVHSLLLDPDDGDADLEATAIIQTLRPTAWPSVAPGLPSVRRPASSVSPKTPTETSIDLPDTAPAPPPPTAPAGRTGLGLRRQYDPRVEASQSPDVPRPRSLDLNETGMRAIPAPAPAPAAAMSSRLAATSVSASAGAAPASLPARPATGPAANSGRPVPVEFAELEIPGYELVSMLGRGGMGIVFLARQQRLERFVAIKMLHQDLSGDSDYVKRLQREARTLASLSHPHIVGCHDILTLSSGTFFIMEYVPGRLSVRDLIRQFTRVPEAQAIHIVLQAARGLSYALSKEVIHRDIKPDNLQVFSDLHVQPTDLKDVLDAPTTRVMIVDFGLAKTATTHIDEQLAELSTEGLVVGSPAYMAPEQAMGIPVDYRADIYALGASLHHMLTGNTPFAANTPMQTLNLKLEQDLPDPREDGIAVSPECMYILRRMTHRDPDGRYQSYPELIADLEKLRMLLDPANFANVTSIRLKRLPSPARRRFLRTVAGIAAFTLLITGIVYFLSRRDPFLRQPLLSTDLIYWQSPDDSWGIVQPDDESIDELALTSQNPGARLNLIALLPDRTRVFARVRLTNPGDGAAALHLSDGERDLWTLRFTRLADADGYDSQVDGEAVELPPLKAIDPWEWRVVDLRIDHDTLTLYVDDQLAFWGKIRKNVNQFSLVLSHDSGAAVQFKDVRIGPLPASANPVGGGSTGN